VLPTGRFSPLKGYDVYTAIAVPIGFFEAYTLPARRLPQFPKVSAIAPGKRDGSMSVFFTNCKAESAMAASSGLSECRQIGGRVGRTWKITDALVICCLSEARQTNGSAPTRTIDRRYLAATRQRPWSWIAVSQPPVHPEP